MDSIPTSPPGQRRYLIYSGTHKLQLHKDWYTEQYYIKILGLVLKNVLATWKQAGTRKGLVHRSRLVYENGLVQHRNGQYMEMDWYSETDSYTKTEYYTETDWYIKKCLNDGCCSWKDCCCGLPLRKLVPFWIPRPIVKGC